MNTIERNYEQAKEKYATIGVDTDAVLEKIQDIKISMHCWQGDDVKGFLTPDGELTGGIMATGIFQEPHEHLKSLDKIWRRLIR